MKAFILLTSLMIGTQSFAGNNNYQIHLNWADKASLQDSVVQQCDDTYYSGVDIVIPGKPNENFSIEMPVDISSGQLSPGCSIKVKTTSGSTTYSFDAGSGGGCTIKVYKIRKNYNEQPQSATYDIGESC